MLKFGTAGIPHSAKNRSSVDGVRRIRELKLDCMELEFVQGVKMGETAARELKKAADAEKVDLTVHAPYFINLASLEEKKVIASMKRITDSARIGFFAGAKSVVFHAAFYMKSSHEEVFNTVEKRLDELISALKKEGINIDIRPELTGKPSQFGSLNELLALSKVVKGVKPCIDFAHNHARLGGGNNSYDDFMSVFEQIRKKLGKKAVKNMHIHVAGIEYGPKGERKHLNLKDSDFKYKEFAKALKDSGAEGWVICESPNLEEDAKMLKRAYEGV